ncbi:MAG: 30S ribosomal protein S9 [Microgenomates bacterium 39_7]|nr:MAG: 30S ribosomal protein S9 [Microgenomates bacterium 39_7]
MQHKTQISNIVKRAKKSEKGNHRNEALKPVKSIKYPEGEYIEGIGRRKVATARVRIYKSSGDFIVNDNLVSDYFADVPQAEKLYKEPFVVTKTEGEFAVTAVISGSGKSAQLGALIHGLSRALEKYNPELRPFLKESDLLSRDDRMKETRKPGRGGKARRKRQSPKR